MMFHRLGLIHKNQRGFTLIELLIAVAITGLVIGGITMAIFQVINGSARTNNHMTAVRQVQNAGYWVSHDAQMAQNVNTDDPAPTGETEIITLSWVGWERVDKQGNQFIDSYKVCYIYDADNDKLRRQQTITTTKYDKYGQLVDPPPDQDSTTVIADYIDPPTATMLGNKLIVTITASVGDAEEQRTYEITPRPST